MVTRADVVAKALSYDGYHNGVGYPGPQNEFSADLNRPSEFWCGDFVTDIFKRLGIALPSMQDSCRTGYAYCPSGEDACKSKKAFKSSWEAQPGDFVFFNIPGADHWPSHTGIVEKWENGVLWTIEGDSNASNVDNYRGNGGVHRHKWSAPKGVGNSIINGIGDADAFVDFKKEPNPWKPGKAPRKHPRTIMLKSPLMHGKDVKRLQKALDKRGHKLKVDGAYGPNTKDAVKTFQKNHNLHVDGIFGLKTRRKLYGIKSKLKVLLHG